MVCQKIPFPMECGTKIDTRVLPEPLSNFSSIKGHEKNSSSLNFMDPRDELVEELSFA